MSDLPDQTAEAGTAVPLTVALAQRQARCEGLDAVDATVLLALVMAQTRTWLRAHDDQVLTPAQAQHFQALLQRRLRGEPMAYLAGEKEFHGLTLQVDARVLVPRPDTETLVDWGLAVLTDLLAQDPANHPPLQVADLGCGSGAIALAVSAQACARGWPITVHAVDISADALAVTRTNAQRLNLPILAHQGAWWAPLATLRCHLVMSNPPYIAEGDPHLPALGFEPRTALTAGPDGLDDLREIIAQAPQHLVPGGWLLLEHGWDQAAAVRQLLIDAGMQQVSSRQDLAGIERCSGGQVPF